MTSDADSPNLKNDSHSSIETPPTSFFGIVSRIGPGLIVAGSIVGSGELIATTKTGAEAGFSLLWLILIGCLIKVFVQVEFGRYAITASETSIKAMNRVPGPSIAIRMLGGGSGEASRGNWLVWYWFAMFLVSLAQLGGIVGGVGQALAISMPITAEGKAFDEQVEVETKYKVTLTELARENKRESPRSDVVEAFESELKTLRARLIKTRQEVAEEQIGAALAKGDEQQLATWEKAASIVTTRLAASQSDVKSNAIKIFDDAAADVSADLNEDEAARLTAALNSYGKRQANDHKYWAAIIAVATCIILMSGRYGLIQTFSTVMVASFTLITIVNLVALQMAGDWAVTWSEVWEGMQFRLPPKERATAGTPVATALFTFGIIGVGASELVTYPYWCLEKGYAKYTGPRDSTDAWEARARGWLKVMQWDAMLSMVVYTFATIAFYLLGAAILGRVGLNPGGQEMIRTLAVMYEPVFGTWTQTLFLFGAFAVLYSTFFVANASHARVFPDALRVLGFGSPSDKAYRTNVRIYSGIFPLACLLVYIVFPKPATLVLASGFMQALMLPMLSAAALYFRYYRCDQRLKPSLLWDIFLWVSAAGMFISGGWAAWTKVTGG